ncbi:MAG: hypothetical protein H6581_22135 [Bacteroidia bacterium]|nr:hypothetical protein [Bacteroidia bacterium]
MKTVAKSLFLTLIFACAIFVGQGLQAQSLRSVTKNPTQKVNTSTQKITRAPEKTANKAEKTVTTAPEKQVNNAERSVEKSVDKEVKKETNGGENTTSSSMGGSKDVTNVRVTNTEVHTVCGPGCTKACCASKKQ